VAFVLVFVEMVGGGVMVMAKFALKRNSQGNKGRAEKQLQRFKYIKRQQSKEKLDYLSEKQNSKKKQELSINIVSSRQIRWWKQWECAMHPNSDELGKCVYCRLMAQFVSLKITNG
jgi:hypothetical protein